MARSTTLEKLSCPDCSTQPNTHLQTFINIDDALGMEYITSYCYGCEEAKGDPYSGTKVVRKKVKTDAELRQDAEVIRGCKFFKPKGSYRGIPSKYFKSWGLRLLLSEFDGTTPYAIGFPYSNGGKLSGWKARALKKKSFFAIGKKTGSDPFGLERAFKVMKDTVFVTEGEFDAIALDYCLYLATGKNNWPVISLADGGDSIENDFDKIESRLRSKGVKHVVLVLDNDKIGKKAEQKGLAMWPKWVKIVKKPAGFKDANDALEGGHGKEMGKLALNFK